jgi:hypothetical protein
MAGKIFRLAAVSVGLIVMLSASGEVRAQETKTAYPSMAPLEQYVIADRDAEIAMARSAAPESISKDAEVMVLGKNGYETAAKGTNGFVCMVERSWTAGFDDPEFWNPRLRAPICFNPPGARYNVPLTMKKIDLAVAGSPVLGFEDKENRFTLYLIPVGKWSDGTAAEDH